MAADEFSRKFNSCLLPTCVEVFKCFTFEWTDHNFVFKQQQAINLDVR